MKQASHKSLQVSLIPVILQILVISSSLMFIHLNAFFPFTFTSEYVSIFESESLYFEQELHVTGQ